MQTSARKSSLLTARFDSATGKRRPFWYGWRAIAAGAVLALLAGSGIAVAAVASAAEAHNHKITVTCVGITVHGDWYDTSKGDINTVDVTIGDVTTHETFGAIYDKFFPFPNSATAPTVYSATIQGWDGYKEDASGTSQPCPTPSIALDAPTCTTVNGTITLAATVSNLDNSHAYTIELTSPDGNGATTSPASALTVAGGAASKSWPVVPGHNYSVTVVDTTVLPVVLTASKSVVSVGCPQTPGLTIKGTECAVPGGSGTFTLTATGLSFGRDYTIALYDTANTLITSTSATGDLTGGVVVGLAAPPSGTYYATITDKADPSSTKTSGTLSFLPCPKTPAAPAIDPSQCTSTNGTPNSSITFSASGLVPGRTYQVTISNGTVNVFDSTPFVAASSTFAEQTLPFPPGTYTVTVVDVLLPGFVSSTTAEIIACPLLPDLGLTPTQCSVPGGTGDIALTVTNFVATRSYTFTVTQNGATVGSPVTLAAPATPSWTPTVPALSGLPAGLVYRIIVTDTVVPTVIASGDVSLAVCPGNPSITVKASCNVLGTSTASVSAGQLVSGETYSVTILKTSNSAIVSAQSVTGANPTAALQFKNVPNGNNYTVAIANATSSLTGSTTFFLKACDLPTLAFTGANPVGPAVAGIGFLQVGLMLLALNLVVRRRRTI
ncbi:MAG: hypothetical protein ABI632_05640 [Pseudolysinimonas sp.]